jgi:hypothetical protein
MADNLQSTKMYKQGNIRIQPLSVFDIIDLMYITKKEIDLINYN